MKIVKQSGGRHVLTLPRVAWLVGCCCAASLASGDVRPWSTAVCLEGRSLGGVLSLGYAGPVNSPYVAVTNEPGANAETVVRRLAAQLAAAEAAFNGKRVESVADSRLVLYGSNPWMFGGTERGFSIPAPVTSLSASFIQQGRKVVLRWANPPGGYKCIHVIYKGRDAHPGVAALRRLGGLPGETTEYVHHPDDPSEPLLWSSDVDAIVVGYSKDGTPSNGTGIRLLNHVREEALMNVPFTRGLAPGFQAWTDPASGGSVKVEQGELLGMAPGAATGRAQRKGFYQVVSGNGTFRGGVARSFLGLTPGHAYRASARMNTLQAKEGAWSLSFHAAPNPPGRRSLTPEQMSGMAQLLDQTKRPTAGQIAKYDYATATKGEWVSRSSGADGPGKSVGDITLPAGCDSITLWFRLEGTNATDTACGLDSVALEDLGKR
jgi:hypothetical protein